MDAFEKDTDDGLKSEEGWRTETTKESSSGVYGTSGSSLLAIGSDPDFRGGACRHDAGFDLDCDLSILLC